MYFSKNRTSWAKQKYIMTENSIKKSLFLRKRNEKNTCIIRRSSECWCCCRYWSENCNQSKTTDRLIAPLAAERGAFKHVTCPKAGRLNIVNLSSTDRRDASNENVEVSSLSSWYSPIDVSRAIKKVKSKET